MIINPAIERPFRP